LRAGRYGLFFVVGSLSTIVEISQSVIRASAGAAIVAHRSANGRKSSFPAYATGISWAIPLADRELNGGPDKVEKYFQFLNLGCSKAPGDALREVGINILSPEPIKEALKLFETRLDRLRQLSAEIDVSAKERSALPIRALRRLQSAPRILSRGGQRR
jgi:hypothetical protein